MANTTIYIGFFFFFCQIIQSIILFFLFIDTKIAVGRLLSTGRLIPFWSGSISFATSSNLALKKLEDQSVLERNRSLRILFEK